MPRLVLVLCIISLLPTLGGCALLPTYQLASLAVTGLSYMLTGKSLPDHALSTVTQRDCSMMRVMNGGEVCSDPADQVPQVMIVGADTEREVVEALAPAPKSVAGAHNDALIDIAGVEALAPEPEPTALYDLSEVAQQPALDSLLIATTVSTANVATLDESPQLYVVIGSYRDRNNAESKKAGHAQSSITEASIEGRAHYRVVLGPYGDSIARLATDQNSELNLAGRWSVWLCPDTLHAPPCGMNVASAN